MPISLLMGGSRLQALLGLRSLAADAAAAPSCTLPLSRWGSATPSSGRPRRPRRPTATRARRPSTPAAAACRGRQRRRLAVGRPRGGGGPRRRVGLADGRATRRDARADGALVRLRGDGCGAARQRGLQEDLEGLPATCSPPPSAAPAPSCSCSRQTAGRSCGCPSRLSARAAGRARSGIGCRRRRTTSASVSCSTSSRPSCVTMRWRASRGWA